MAYLAIIKTATDLKNIDETKRPCYVLIVDEDKPQLTFLAKNKTPIQLPMHPYGFANLKDYLKLDERIIALQTKSVLLKKLPAFEKEYITSLIRNEVNYSQSKLTSLFNDYFKRNNHKTRINEGGICAGLAAVYCKYTVENKEDEFFEMLAYITNHSESKRIEDIPQINSFIAEVLYAFEPGDFDKNLSQNHSIDVLKVSNPLDSNEEKNLKSVFYFNAATTAKQWELIFKEIKFKDAVYDIGIPQHATAMTYKNNEFYLYDPNYKEGTKVFASEKEALKEIATKMVNMLIEDAFEKKGTKVEIPTTEGSLFIEITNNQYFLYDDLKDPNKCRIFQYYSELENEIYKSLIQNEKFIIDMGVRVIENPYQPIENFNFPDQAKLLQSIMDSKEFNVYTTLERSVANNNLIFTEQVIDYLVDPKNTKYPYLIYSAIARRAYDCLQLLLNHPRFTEDQFKWIILKTLGSNIFTSLNDKIFEVFVESALFKGIDFSTHEKSTMLLQAVKLNNMASTKQIINMLNEHDIEEAISVRILYITVHEGKTELLDALLAKKEASQFCLYVAIEENNVEMVRHLLTQFPEKNLAQYFNLTTELIKKTNAPILFLLKENGATYAKSEEENMEHSLEEAKILMDIVENIHEQNPEKLAKLCAISNPNTRDKIANSLSEMILEKKIPLNTAALFIDPANLSVGVGLIQKISGKYPFNKPFIEAVQNKMESMLELHNNNDLNILINIKPKLSLDYVKLYDKAQEVQRQYNNSYYISKMFFSAKPDPRILTKLKKRSESQEQNISKAYATSYAADFPETLLHSTAEAKVRPNQESNQKRDTPIKQEPEKQGNVQLKKVLEQYQEEFNTLLVELKSQQENLVQKAKTYPEYKEVADSVTISYDTLNKQQKKFFDNPEATSLKKLHNKCMGALETAERKSQELQGWYEAHTAAKNIVGVLTAITAIPALMVQAISQNGFSKTFFEKQEIDNTSQKMTEFKKRYETLTDKMEEALQKTEPSFNKG